MVLAVMPETKAMEKLAAEISHMRPMRVRGLARRAMNRVQCMASIRLPMKSPAETRPTSLHRGQRI